MRRSSVARAALVLAIAGCSTRAPGRFVAAEPADLPVRTIIAFQPPKAVPEVDAEMSYVGSTPVLTQLIGEIVYAHRDTLIVLPTEGVTPRDERVLLVKAVLVVRTASVSVRVYQPPTADENRRAKERAWLLRGAAAAVTAAFLYWYLSS